MKKFIFILLFILVCCSQKAEYNQELENLETFAKVYGYVKYFHPSDEAAEVNWRAFAIYGADQIAKCKSKEALASTLQILFEPIAPSINFTAGPKSSKLNLALLTPNDMSDYLPTYWQHRGVGVGMNSQYQSPYFSTRVNGVIKKDYSSIVSKITMSVNAANYKKKKIKYKAFAKNDDGKQAEGYLRLVVEKSDGTSDLKREEIIGNKWEQYEIIEDLDSLTTSINIGFAMRGKGSLSLDAAQLFYEDDGEWIEIRIPNKNFEKDILVSGKQENKWYHEGVGYSHEITTSDYYNGEKSALMKYTGVVSVEKGLPLFDYKPEFGELIKEEIANDLYCEIPLVLYSNGSGTFPQGNEEKLKWLTKELANIETKPIHESVRLGNVINTYNVFQHFYPYMDVVGLNWDQEFKKALLRCFKDVSESDHLVTLQKFTAPLKDGHISVDYNRFVSRYTPRITWEWVEDKLVITNVLDEKLQLSVGDIVTGIEGQDPLKYFEEIYSRISAGTKGWLDFRANAMSLMGDYGSKMTITVNNRDVEMERSGLRFNEGARSAMHEKINDHVYYLNITSIEMVDIERLLPELVKSKSIICDLRGYPNRNHGLINYLLKEDDTTEDWMQLPKILRPNEILDFENANWMLKKKEPYLGNKQIIFLTDGRAISYAESYMGFIDGYNLATIVGQPTAGTNGNVNSFDLPGGYSIRWTGMKVVKHDGSQLHGIGFIPDILVSKTIKGVKEGRDEILEKAIELTQQ